MLTGPLLGKTSDGNISEVSLRRSGLGKFVVSGIHRIIRHPWYLGGILIVWAQDLIASTILINRVVSVYFMIGAVLE